MLSESDFENHEKNMEVAVDSELKDWVVNYVGNKIATNQNVTVEMIVEVFAVEFPEFLMAIAEENFFRGYEQALDDLNHAKLMEEDNEESDKSREH